jgi:histidinol-phosphatase
MSFQRELEVALSIARRAGELALHYFAQDTPASEKDDLSPVTVADHECEKLISRLISDNFSEDGIMGEEGMRKQSRSGRRWIVDPIDGTRDFVRRTPFWSVLLALEVESQVVLGIIHFPYLKETVFASLGKGCFHNGVQVRASTITRIDKSILTVSAFKDAWKAWDPQAVRFLTEQCWTVRAYCGCYDIAMLAQGKVDIWLSGGGSEWDYAPARIVARECGAHFLTRDGSDRIDACHCLVCAPGLELELRGILGIPASPPVAR